MFDVGLSFMKIILFIGGTFTPNTFTFNPNTGAESKVTKRLREKGASVPFLN